MTRQRTVVDSAATPAHTDHGPAALGMLATVCVVVVAVEVRLYADARHALRESLVARHTES